MMNPMFVDTAAWMAMADAKDPLNALCRNARDQWLEAGGVLMKEMKITVALTADHHFRTAGFRTLPSE